MLDCYLNLLNTSGQEDVLKIIEDVAEKLAQKKQQEHEAGLAGLLPKGPCLDVVW